MRYAAFTLLELLIVISIIIVLAGLVIGTAGYVQKRGARSRAEAEIAAMSAALESYKADNGIYPQFTNLNPRSDFDPANYDASSLHLYNSLSGAENGSRVPAQGATSYFSFKPNMLSPRDQSETVTAIRDPFGNSYGYSTAGGYNPTFDLWSTAAGTTQADVPGWIKNW